MTGLVFYKSIEGKGREGKAPIFSGMTGLVFNTSIGEKERLGSCSGE